VAVSDKGTVRVEIVPWLTRHFGTAGASNLILEEEVAGALSLGDFLTALARKYPAVGTVILDLDAGQLFEHVSVVRNDTVLGSATVLEERIEAGDSLVLLPAFSGG
jgi:molybdopterin converting factor small subunit